MRKIFTFAAILLVPTVFVNAQISDPELDYIRKTYAKEKKTIVNDYLELDSVQNAKFLPLFEAFETGREKLATERLDIIKEYAANVNNITPELADKLVSKGLDNNSSLDKLNAKYYKKMKKAIGAVNAAKFIQLEYYLQTTWRGAVQDNIPLIGELDKTQKK